MRIAYFYWMSDDAARVGEVVPRHTAYWRELRLPEYTGGPLTDRSGGLITFEAASVEQAERTIANDPFVQERLVESATVKEWMPE
jgi:uncharacterized protein YciI